MKSKNPLKRIVGLLFAAMFAFCATACSDGSGVSKTEMDLTAEDFNCSYTYPQVDLNSYTTFYFDAENGNDANAGTSEAAPKKTLTAAETVAAAATESNPVRILLKRGVTFEGNWHLSGYQSTEEKPLIIDAYGLGDEYPVIDGHGTDIYSEDDCATILVKDDNIRLLNLEVTGITAYQGIYVYTSTGGAFENVVIENCYVHDINFNWVYDTEPKDTSPEDIKVETVCPKLRLPQNDNYGRYVYRKYSAISFYPGSLTEPSWFENIWILNNDVVNVGKIGINVYSMWNNQPGFGYGYNKYLGEDAENNADSKLGRFPNKYVVCKDNYLECCGADGIVLSGCEDSVLEGNVSYYANYLGRAGYWNASIWVFGSRRILFQYNEAAYTYMRNGGQDAQGFDIDNACSEVYFRFNYAHHNEGGGLLLCNKETSISYYDANGTLVDTKTEWGIWNKNYICNNVFAYNGNPWTSNRSAFITIARTVSDTYIYNNTVILDPAIYNQSVINTEDQSANCSKLYFYNNLFYSTTDSQAQFTVNMMYDYEFANNLFHNVTSTGLDTNDDAITEVDPQFTIEGSVNGFESLTAFRPANSSVLKMGKKYEGATAVYTDILKQDTRNKSYLGAICE